MRSALALILVLLGITARAADRPNFVWLISEDNSIHYSSLYVQSGAAAPCIKNLAAEGVIFNHAFCVSPVCSSARSTLATGCYSSRIGVQHHRRFEPATLPDGVLPIYSLLRDAGYYTSNKTKTDYNFASEGSPWHSNRDWHGRTEGQPFFHKQTFFTTHESQLFHVRSADISQEKMSLPPYMPDTPLFKKTVQTYHRLHEKMDREVGAVIEALKTEGLLEDTFIFYFGDNGGVLPRSKGFLFETGLHVPLVVRIPENWRHLVDLECGTRVDGFVNFTDFAPTILNLAGIKPPMGTDGKPFMGPGITRADLERRDEVFGMADRMGEKCGFVRSFRKGKYKYIRNYLPYQPDGLHHGYRYEMPAYREWCDLYKAGMLDALQGRFFEPTLPEMLFDLETDPHETANLATDPQYTEILKRMRNRLTSWVKELPDLSFYPESFLIEKAFNPSAFGISHQKDISKLVDIADLALVSFDQAKPGIDHALESENPWARYWGLIVCSTQGKPASVFIEKAKSLTTLDPEPLVRVRAAEFLGLIGAADPRPVLMDVLAETEEPLVALITLNTVVLLHDSKLGYEFDISPNDVKAKSGATTNRLQYLAR